MCTSLFQSFPSSQPPFLLLHISYYISSSTELCSLPLPGYLNSSLFLYISRFPFYISSNWVSCAVLYIRISSSPNWEGAVHFLLSQSPFSSFRSQLPVLLISYLLNFYTQYMYLSHSNIIMCCVLPFFYFTKSSSPFLYCIPFYLRYFIPPTELAVLLSSSVSPFFFSLYISLSSLYYPISDNNYFFLPSFWNFQEAFVMGKWNSTISLYFSRALLMIYSENLFFVFINFNKNP